MAERGLGKEDLIVMAHGGGGGRMHRLVREVVLDILGEGDNAAMNDAAKVALDGERLAFTTDSFVVKPVFFPGGDIGSLCVSGTVNDLLMVGGKPAFISLGLVLEEGLPLRDLVRVLYSIRRTAEEADVRIVTGDTKVVHKGEADRIFINTAGVGTIPPGIEIGGNNARAGDAVIVSGGIGEHGIAVMAERSGLRLAGDIRSDAAPLNHIVLPMLERFGGSVHALRDPTRGGMASSLNEIAGDSGVSISIDESAVPVREPVRAVCELLGLDPFHLPSEGRFLTLIDGAAAKDALHFLRTGLDCPLASVIGEVRDDEAGTVILHTASGGQRILDMPEGELLPRIC